MQKFLLALSLAVLAHANSSCFAQGQQPAAAKRKGLFTQTSIEKGWKTSTQQQKPMLVMFTSDNCKYCKKMLTETYDHPAIKQMLTGNTHTVLAHAEDYQALVKKLGIRGYPSSVLVSPNGDVLEFMEGYVSPKDFAQRVSPILRARARAAQLPKKTAGR